MLSQGHVGASLYHYTGQVASRFWDSCSPEEWKWCHNVMVEANIHLRPLHTSILGIYKVIEPLVCCLKSMWVHHYTVTQAKLVPYLGSQGHLRNENDAIIHGWGWYSPQTASYIHIRHIKSVWGIGIWSQGHVGAPLYCYFNQVGHRFGDSGSLEEWKWCHTVMVEADIHLKEPLHTSIFDIYKVFEPLVCCLKCKRVLPYTFTPAKLVPCLGRQGHLRSRNVATTSWLRPMSASDCFIHP